MWGFRPKAHQEPLQHLSERWTNGHEYARTQSACTHACRIVSSSYGVSHVNTEVSFLFPAGAFRRSSHFAGGQSFLRGAEAFFLRKAKDATGRCWQVTALTERGTVLKILVVKSLIFQALSSLSSKACFSRSWIF